MKSDRSTLRILGSVGEPLNPEAWKWLYAIVGQSQCAIVDTYWQTETGMLISLSSSPLPSLLMFFYKGAHMLTNLPGAQRMKPACTGLPFFGTEPVILDPRTGKPLEGATQGVLVYANPWPSIARTVYGDHQRYIDTYLKMYPGYFFTGDEARRDADGYYRILGRIDGTSSPSYPVIFSLYSFITF